MTIPEGPLERPPVPQTPLPSLVPPTPTNVEPAGRRPVCVTVIAILFFVGALAELSGVFKHDFADTLTLVSQIDSGIFTLANIAVGVGLLTWQPAARMAAIVALIVRFVTSVPLVYLTATYHTPSSGVPPEITIAVEIGVVLMMGIYYGVLLFFLTRPGVKAAFDAAG